MKLHPYVLALLTAGCSLSFAMILGAFGEPAPPVAPNRNASPTHGRQLFILSCSHCHGNDARGSGEDGDGPDLFELAIGNARIAAVIRCGIPEEMPSFAKKHGPADIADLTAYLRTLR